MTCSSSRQSASTSLKSLLGNSSSGTFGFQRQDISHLRSFFVFLEQQRESPSAKRLPPLLLSSVRLDDASSMQQALFTLYLEAERALCDLLVEYVKTLSPPSDPPTSNAQQALERKPLCYATLDHKIRRLGNFLRFAQSQSEGTDDTATGKPINLLERHHPVWGKLYQAVHAVQESSRKKAKTGSTSCTPAGSPAPCSRNSSPAPTEPRSPSASATLAHAPAASSVPVILPPAQAFLPCQLVPMAMMPMQAMHPMHLVMWPCFGIPMQAPSKRAESAAHSQIPCSSALEQQQQQHGEEEQQPASGAALVTAPSSPKAACRVFRPVARPAQAAPLLQTRQSQAPATALVVAEAVEAAAPLLLGANGQTGVGEQQLHGKSAPRSTTSVTPHPSPVRLFLPSSSFVASPRPAAGQAQHDGGGSASPHLQDGSSGNDSGSCDSSACVCGEATAASPLRGCATGPFAAPCRSNLPGPDVKDLLPLPLDLLLQRLRSAGSCALLPRAPPAAPAAALSPASAATKELQRGARAARVQRFLSKRRQRPSNGGAAKQQAAPRLLQ